MYLDLDLEVLLLCMYIKHLHCTCEKKICFYNCLHSFQIIFEHNLYEQKETIINNLDNPAITKKLLLYVARQFVKKDMVLDVDWLGSPKGVFYESGMAIICQLDELT